MRKRLAEEGMGHIDVRSAGTLNFDGEKAADLSIKVCADIDVDISKHKSAPLVSESVDEADIILAMEVSHIVEISKKFPEARSKTCLLGDFLEPGMGIDDPVGRSIEYYQAALEKIRAGVDGFIEWLHVTKQFPDNT